MKNTNRIAEVKVKEDVLRANDLLAAGTPMIVFDLETTGLNAVSDRILSFSAIKVVINNGISDIKEVKDIFINPGFHIPDNVSEINGITDETVKDCPLEGEAFNEIKAFLGEKPFLCGYNSVSFDEKFLKAMYARAGMTLEPLFHVDVLKMAREKLTGLVNHKLITVAHELGADTGLTFHRSLDDVKATYRCFDILKTEYLIPDQENETECEVQKEKKKLWIDSVSYWEGPNHKLKRVYIQTNPYSKTFYDVYKNEWTSEDPDVDLEYIRTTVLRLQKVEDGKALARKLSTKSPA